MITVHIALRCLHLLCDHTTVVISAIMVEVQKNFNSLLENYRADILPKVVNSWEQMTPEEQLGIKVVYTNHLHPICDLTM